MRVVIRTDASMTRGSGHVTRCLCLADELSRLGHVVTFATIGLPDHLRDLVAAGGHKVTDLPDQGESSRRSEEAWPDAIQSRDAEATLAAAAAELVVVDHYGLGETWERSIARDDRSVVAIDDLGRSHACHLLLDQNFYRDHGERYTGKLPVGTRQLIGPRFALVRPEFAVARRAQRLGRARRVLTFVGGMDAGDVTSHILRALDGLAADLFVDVVIGALHPQRPAIEALCAQTQGWTCHVQTDRMAQLLAAADLVIGSGGTNTWERMAVGVPALALCIADNQRMLLDECAAASLLLVPDDGALTDAAALRIHIVSLLANQRLLGQLSSAGMAQVDGNGAARVARAASALQRISVRSASATDSGRLLAWRNHEAIRAVSRSKEFIEADAHHEWLDRVLADPTRSLLVGERDGQPVGCARFDENGPDSAEISIYLAPEAIGTGAGPGLLDAAEAWLAENRPHIARIDAEVLGSNYPSTHLFERAGYRLDHVRYSKGLHI